MRWGIRRHCFSQRRSVLVETFRNLAASFMGRRLSEVEGRMDIEIDFNVGQCWTCRFECLRSSIIFRDIEVFVNGLFWN